jgi:hypothetical protein
VASSTGGSYPFNILDLTNWKITIPYDGSDSGTDADEVKRPTLDTYSNTGWFWADADKIWVNFRADAGAATTSGSLNVRSELREMNSGGLSEIYWSLMGSTVYRLEGICKVTTTPSSGKLCFAQIHAKEGELNANGDEFDDVIRLQVRTSGSSHVVYVMGACVKDASGTEVGDNIRTQAVGAEINYAIEASSGKVRVYMDGALVKTYDNVNTKSTQNYFKAGNYLQSKPTSGYGVVKYRYVWTSNK